MKSAIEHNFTSTGVKFFRHPDQMEAYQEGFSNTVISTHISPEGLCNLNCSYCSVRDRQPGRIELPVIKQYIEELILHGLRAVILTGGGEPTLYPQFEELVSWLHERVLQIGLITNGVHNPQMNEETWKMFSWVRISLNVGVITLPIKQLSEKCTLGFSKIWSPNTQPISLSTALEIMNKFEGTYLRLLPDCTLSSEEYRLLEVKLLNAVSQYGPEIFVQQKQQRAPRASICHQAYFRPYLSEYSGGVVFPCDSVVLNGNGHKFIDQYAICKAIDVGEFLSKKIGMNFRPCDDCPGCVFADTVDMLEDWTQPIEHEDFV